MLNKMSIYLIIGFIFAGILHVFIKPKTIARHLGENNFLSVLKASLFGIPLPLCSCGVLPATISLKKDGASKGAILSFLISTPTTGLDSVFATYALLGPFFTAFRVVASFISGLVAGVMANIFLEKDTEKKTENQQEKCTDCGQEHGPGKKLALRNKIKSIFTYSFGTLLRESGAWIMLGIIIGGAISYFVPEELISRYLGSPWLSMLVMLIVGIPMYICSSGSVPVVAALMLKGMSPAAAFVFLLAGPATNSVALTVISRELGKRTAFLFLLTIVLCSLSLGFLVHYLFYAFDIDLAKQLKHHQAVIPLAFEHMASLTLVGLIILNFIKDIFNKMNK